MLEQPQNRSRWILVCTAALAATFAFSLASQPSSDPGTETTIERPDPEALRAMEREERRAAVRAYREARLAAIRSSGESQGAPGYRPLAEPRPVGQAGLPRPKVAGTSIQYDSGTVTGFVVAADFGRLVGNRYDTAVGAPVENSGTITGITFEMLRTSRSQVVWSLYSDIMGTSAVQVDSVTVAAAVGLNTITIDPAMTNNVYRNGPFLAGIFQFGTQFTRVGVDTNSSLGQGFHAITINDPVTAAPNTGMGLQTLGNRNIVFRVRGNVVTPVELMHFEVEASSDGD